RISSLLGRPEAVVMIHGGMGREERRKAQDAFMQDKGVQILVATDAAGEGLNLQRAHLMVNYDLPWNPNRLEQRFGRIHRIGQTEVCHLWNLLAEETREGGRFSGVSPSQSYAWGSTTTLFIAATSFSSFARVAPGCSSSGRLHLDHMDRGELS